MEATTRSDLQERISTEKRPRQSRHKYEVENIKKEEVKEMKYSYSTL